MQIQTAESNLKRSLALAGRPRPEAVRIKISESSKGKKMSDDARVKMSLSKKRLYQEHPEIILRGERAYWHLNQFSKEHREKLSKAGTGRPSAMLGKNHSDETKEKMAAKHRGVQLTENHKRHLSLSKMGEKNPSWKNGMSYEPYSKVWADRAYKKKIMKRDGNKCRNESCNKKYKKLGIHHINYIKKDCSPENLITLCISCNIRANFNRPRWQQYYTGLMEENRNG